MNSVESVVNSRRDWYDHSGKPLTKVVMPKFPSITKSIAKSIANSYQIEKMTDLVKIAKYIVFQLANSEQCRVCRKQ